MVTKMILKTNICKERQSDLSLLIGVSADADPTLRNSAPESPTFGAIAKVNPTGVQWKGYHLGERPSWSPSAVLQWVCAFLTNNFYIYVNFICASYAAAAAAATEAAAGRHCGVRVSLIDVLASIRVHGPDGDVRGRPSLHLVASNAEG